MLIFCSGVTAFLYLAVSGSMFWLRVGMVNTPDGWVFGTSC